MNVQLPERYRVIFDRVLAHDEWLFDTIPSVMTMRRYIKGEFWPVVEFDKPDSEIWVEVVRLEPGLYARRPVGFTKVKVDWN
jgi:hypothetical protein